MRCFCRWTSHLQSSSIVRGSVKLWRGSSVQDQKPSTAPLAPSALAASCPLKKSARSVPGLRTIPSNSYKHRGSRMERLAAQGQRTFVPLTSLPTPMYQHQTWSWVGLKKAPGCQRGMSQCTPVLLQTGNLLSERSSDGTSRRPAKYAKYDDDENQ